MSNREYLMTLSDYDFVRYIYDVLIPLGRTYNNSVLGITEWLGKKHE